MSIRNSIMLTVTTVFLAAALPVIAECSPAPNQPQANTNLSPEQQAVMFMDARDKLRSMTPDQRKAYKKQLRQQWASLSAGQKAQEQQQLNTEWNALPQARRDKIESHLQQHGGKHDGDGQASDESEQ